MNPVMEVAQPQCAVGAGGKVTALSCDDGEFAHLRAASEKFIRDSRLEAFGTDYVFIAPFSRQFKLALRAYHEADEESYNRTDQAEMDARRAVKRLRWWTYAVFCAISIMLGLVWWNVLHMLTGDAAVQMRAEWLYLGAAPFSLLLRMWIRSASIERIEKNAKAYAIVFMTDLSRIHDVTQNAVQCSQTDLMMTTKWPERSAGWIKIALWLGRRYDDLTRYVTVTGWRISSRYRWYERAAIAGKAATVVAVLIAIFLAWPTSMRQHINFRLLADTAVYLGVAVIFCWPHKNNDFWSKVTFEGLAAFDEQKKHVHDMIAGVVAADKKYFMGAQHNAVQAPPPQPAASG